MRRKDREKDAEFAYGVFDRAPYAVLAVINEDKTPYCIPVSPARIGTILYFHCAEQGQKLNCIAKDNHVCLSAVSRMKPVEGKFTIEFESAVISGTASIVQDPKEKTEALRKICEKYTPANMDHFDAACIRAEHKTLIVRIDAETITGKQKSERPK